MLRKPISVDYDPINDVLYICLKPGIDSYGDEEREGVIIRKSIQSDEITGITILDFKERYIDSELSSLNLPISIDLMGIAEQKLKA